MKKIILLVLLLIGILPLSAQDDEIPPVIPTHNPDSLITPLGAWDWDTYRTNARYINDELPDPLTIRVPDVYAGNLPALPITDVSQVAYVDELGLSEAQLALLAQNGFIVVPSDVNFFDEAYSLYAAPWETENPDNPSDPFFRPYWISTDALLHTLYLNFENMLKFTELDYLRDAMSLVLARSYSKAYETYQSVVGTPLEEQARSATIFLAVGLGLFNSNSEQAGYWIVQDVQIREEADALIQLARTAEGVLDVPFLAGYQEDFSQYKPRGYYTTDPALSDYFRGMMWLGRITFLAKDDSSLTSSLFLLKALTESGEYGTWRDIADFITFMVGEEDNLGPIHYLPLAETIFGAGIPTDALADATLLEAFRQEVMKLPSPQIANVQTDPLNIPEPDELLEDETRGFRFFGQRFTFDAYVMQNLLNPFVKENPDGFVRPLPSSLDVASALGSDVAYGILQAQGETSYELYVDNMTMLREQVTGFTPDDWFNNIYGGWLWALQPLFVRHTESYPPLMNTRAWQLKDLQTGLGSYTELKHATVLYAAQPEGRGGGGGVPPVPPTSFVEPNPYVFSRIAVIAATLQPKLANFAEQSLQYDYPSIRTISFSMELLSSLSTRLAYLSQKQMLGEPLTDDEKMFLRYDIGGMLNNIRTMLGDLVALEDRPPFSAVVTDIATNPDIEQVLQIGTGKIDYIYVVVTGDDGTLQLARGAVYSFYEFRNDINNRLTDEQWREMIINGQTPPRPDWVSEFMGN